MLHVLHKMPFDRRRMAYRLSQMIKLSFQHIAFFLNLHPTTTLSPTVSRGPIVAHNPLFEFKTPHISKFSWLWVKHRGLTHVNDLYARIIQDMLLGNSRKYPYPTTDGFHVLTPPCLRKFQNALPPHALRIP